MRFCLRGAGVVGLLAALAGWPYHHNRNPIGTQPMVDPHRGAAPGVVVIDSQRGGETSWRDVPRSVVIFHLMSGILLICVGILLGCNVGHSGVKT